ncbi:fimbrillin family protein [Bacteroides sp. 51]|uniref:fimbrillin family protein n=1 Tax=Bacteroides sp. 51 TaxID=2302938 RepID=UPI0013D1978B|nr:fimbrillin family protein [Bacteroides sp. 51]NDV80603.1 hypothetical protein [Bacteroides sp. 51]
MRTTTNIYITALVALLAFSACEDEKTLPSDDANCAYIYAKITGQKEAISRGAAIDSENGTYAAFGAGDEIGLYALGPLYNKSDQSEIDNTPVKNTSFKLEANGRWQVNAKLIWNSTPFGEVKSADIYGYYPYKQHTDQTNVYKNGGYNIFKEANKLEDVLMAERTTVQYDNPAVFLTFKHRFALLKIKLGTGMEGSPATAGAVSAIMSLGIEDNAKIDNQELGQMRLTQQEPDGVKEFKPINVKSGFYYIIVPVEGQATTENSVKADDPLDRFVTDSLKVTHIKVDGQEFPLDNVFAPRMNFIYSLTVHKGKEGSVSVAMGGIEEWGSDRYLSNVREEGGIYWASDLVGLQAALKKIGGAPTKEDEAALAAYGSWDDKLGCFVFPVMRNIDVVNEYGNGPHNSCCIENFYGVLDGRGFTINGLDITSGGLIGTLKEGAVVKDLELKNTTVNNGSSNAGTGALVGHAEDGTTIHNCSVTGTSAVKGGDNTGGLIGSGNPTMDRCSSNADVTGGSNTGGLIGSLTAGGKIDQSYTTGTVTATNGNEVGGLAGSAAGPITNSHAGCDVTGKNNVGGLVGSTTSTIDGCTATGYIEGKDIVGGLAGTTTSTVNKSGANGTVTGTGIVGGLIGKHDVSGDEVVAITGSYTRSTIGGGSPTGGLIGTTTMPYEPAVYEIPEPTEENPDPTPVLKTPAKGTELKNCYTTNGKALISGSGEGISYSYQIGTTNDVGDNAAYTISLNPSPPTDEELDVIIAALNAGSATNPWVKGLVIIDSKSYTLPVLNYK